VSVERGTVAMLVRLREQVAQGAERIGWKVGFNVHFAQEKLGIDAPLAGFLSTDGLLEDGAEVSLADGPLLVESEVAVELADDARSIAALLPALEVVDPPDLDQNVETILAGNIFHRAVVFGPRVVTQTPGAARILVNDEVEHALAPAETGMHLEEMIEAVSRRLIAAGEELAPGDRIITGILAPPHPARPGDRVRLQLDELGGVELLFVA
jgi:2-keto-4-pentenoate hydratase